MYGYQSSIDLGFTDRNRGHKVRGELLGLMTLTLTKVSSLEFYKM